MSWRLPVGDAWQPPCRVAGGRIAGRHVIARPPTRHFIPREVMLSPHLTNAAETARSARSATLIAPVPRVAHLPIPAETAKTARSADGAQGRAHVTALHATSLGAASAGRSWSWATQSDGHVAPLTHAEIAPAAAALPTTTLRMSALLMRMMGDAARAAGRDVAEVWAEAAREWLRRHDRHDDEPQPPAPVAAALAVPRRDQVWCGIDAVLADLRAPRMPAAAPRQAPLPDATTPAGPALAAA